MAINNFISTVWSENLIRSLDEAYVGVAHCNREFEGDIKESGSTVKICGLQGIEIMNYEKGTEIPSPRPLDDFSRELKIDQAKCFNFLIEDIDRAQSNPRLMETAMKAAAKELAKAAERYVFSLYEDSETIWEIGPANKTTLVKAILEARQKLMLAGVTDMSEVVLEVSPEVASVLLKAKLSLCHDQSEILENGSIGKIAGIQVFVSPYVKGSNNTAEGAYYCIMRTRRAVAFADQLSEIEAYRPEGLFADAVKGLHLYGASIIYPDEYIVLLCHSLSLD